MFLGFVIVVLLVGLLLLFFIRKKIPHQYYLNYFILASIFMLLIFIPLCINDFRNYQDFKTFKKMVDDESSWSVYMGKHVSNHHYFFLYHGENTEEVLAYLEEIKENLQTGQVLIKDEDDILVYHHNGFNYELQPAEMSLGKLKKIPLN